MMATDTLSTHLPSGWYRVPEPVRMGIVAITGTFIGWLTYELLFFINPLTTLRGTSTWLVEFAVGVVRQHAMHRYFTFSERSSYWRTLKRAYVYYICCAVLTTIINAILIEKLHLHYRLAWLLCTLLVAALSLLFLKRNVFLITKDRTYRP